MSDQAEMYLGTGRRKSAIARVRLCRGSGNLTVNGKPMEGYCYTEQLLTAATKPLKVVDMLKQVDVTVSVLGGGPVGQSIAISHGLARALQSMNPEYRGALKKEGLLTRDSRVKERKKPGRPGARKRFQFSKR